MRSVPGNWLETPDTQQMLAGVASSVMKYVVSKSLSPSFLGQDARHYDSGDDFSEDIRSELVLFILEHQSGIQKIFTSGNKNCHQYLKRAFINYWIEKTRKPLKDPRRYLYKHAADVLRDSEKFYTFARNNRASGFSMIKECIPIPPLSSEDIHEINFPDHLVARLEYESVNKKNTLLMLAAYFWNQISQMWGNKPVCVDLRDFINWICLYVSVTPPIPVKRLTGGKDPWELTPEHCQKPDEIYFDPELVRKWARNFANRLSQKEKAVFILRHEDDLSLKEIARRLGYKGSSGPKYPLNHAENKLRFFLRDLPWLSPDDLNEEAFSLFRDTLLLILKLETQNSKLEN
ncbi:RNA polymerase sigma factor [Desulfonema magnum]|uniref:RNA polymerase sigma factor, sigma-70 family n=1 Tax=Desulfonema magnum TaxID=45655 RepID=A0A975GPF1_9BACT|nr:sigma-70 region 4 domain-containing protein [Desulfonema magnum]QTA88946.1 RNA polymerase sigma factor, sigma-70 family [Desulfonema magnum]